MKNATEKTPRGADKVAKYDWVVVDKPGIMQMIDKGKLFVDHRYQRDPKSERRILEMCAQWSWVSCGALVVAEGPEGRFAIIDGQHRWLASLRRSDVRHLPCIVFGNMNVKDQSKGFLDSNSGRNPLSGVEKFKAAVLSGQREALIVNELAEESGRTVGPTSDARSIRCVQCLSKHARDNEAMLRKMWPLIVDVCRGHVLSERLVDSLMLIESRMRDGDSLTERRWRSRIMDVGFDELHASMVKFSAAYAQGGARVWALGVIEAVNKGLRNRLVVRGLDKAAA